MKKVLLLVSALFMSSVVWSQEVSGSLLPFDEYLEIVARNHPLGLRAGLNVDLGENLVMKAKGYADPKLDYTLRQKQFDGSEYYTASNIELKVPTVFGLSLHGGFENNSGIYLNPELTTPTDGLMYAGLDLELGRGLIMNERRAVRNQAQFEQGALLQDQTLAQNDLFLSAGLAYFDWWLAYRNYAVFQEAEQVSFVRLEAVKQGALNGDIPTVDTLEATIQLQSRQVQLGQAELALTNSQLASSMYLWSDQGSMIMLNETVQPLALSAWSTTPTAQIMDSLILSHPELVQADFKRQSLEVKRKLDAEAVKPTVNLKYNFLAAGGQPEVPSANNYTLGAEVSMPLFIRKARGELKNTKVKIQQLDFEIQHKQTALQQKVMQNMNEYEAIGGLIDTQQKTVENYSRLLEAERIMFRAGESSLFMVNSREMAYIQAQLKLNKLEVSLQKSEWKLFYSLGVLPKLIQRETTI